jgi:hypothetical protein
VVVGLGLMFGLSSCTVVPGGAIGLTVDASGQLVAVVQMCKGHIDGATVYVSANAPDNEQTLGKWQVDPAVTGFSQFSFAKGGSGWQVDQAFTPRDVPTVYAIYGWSKDNSWSANHLDFSNADLSKLQPDEILYPAFNGTEGLITGSVEDFKTAVCKQNWG